MSSLPVTRHRGTRVTADPTRVVMRPFLPGEEVLLDGSRRIEVAVRRLLAMSPADVSATLASTREAFASRHPGFDEEIDANFCLVAERCEIPSDITAERRALIGTYFTREYSVESAAVGNPSVVVAPDQSGVAPGACRFVMSLRAIGEGHISSIELRTGTIDADATVSVDPPGRALVAGRRASAVYDRGFFTTKLDELDGLDDATRRVLDRLGERFTMAELEASMRDGRSASSGDALDEVAVHTLHWLAASNYTTSFAGDRPLAEQVLLPSGPTESNGMEDVRLVRFVDDDGSVTYYGTYTAYDGHHILPQLLETTDFRSFRISTMAGRSAHNKGIALFPRKVGGRYLALGRHDNVNNFLMSSDDVRLWHETELIQEPKRPWELMQLGNCGSPIETEAGWLVVTHGVGPLRRYSLGALLLDLEDPSQVIGHLPEPLLVPEDDEREGYVPNVVYSCGSLVHHGHLVVPYGFADFGASIATVPLDELLSRLLDRRR